jgi:putative NADPH-quinone reductase
VLVFPIWWNDAPAILKNFFDVNMTPHFAYHYTTREPVGELNKRGYIFATADGPSWIYNTWLSPLRITWNKMRLGFCAVKVKKFTVFGLMRKKTESDLKKMLQKVSDMAQKDVQKYSQ